MIGTWCLIQRHKLWERVCLAALWVHDCAARRRNALYLSLPDE